MTIKTVVTFLLGLVFITTSVINSFHKVKVWAHLTRKQKYDAFSWIVIGVFISAVSGFVMMILISEALDAPKDTSDLTVPYPVTY